MISTKTSLKNTQRQLMNLTPSSCFSRLSRAALAIAGAAALPLFSVGSAFADAPPSVSAQGVPTAPPAPPAQPYSLPWQLRPAAAATVFRSDTSVALYSAGANEGHTVSTMLLGSYKVTPELAPMIRLGLTENQQPGPQLGTGYVFLNPIVGATYAKRFGDYRAAAFLGVTVPVGTGGAKPAGASDIAAMEHNNALNAGIRARSAMDNAMFAVNYTTGIAGLDAAYVANKLTVQVEATLLQLFRVRNSDSMLSTESTRTNFTAGVHVGYFVIPMLSLGGELRHQRWLSTPASVRANPVTRDTTTLAVGPRFHIKVGEKSWIRPGISYTFALDKPLTTADYHIFQLDIPVSL